MLFPFLEGYVGLLMFLTPCYQWPTFRSPNGPPPPMIRPVRRPPIVTGGPSLRSAIVALVFALVANASANVLIRWGMKDLELTLVLDQEWSP